MGLFDVDVKGLREVLSRRGIEYLLFELEANSRDTDATEVEVKFEHVEGRTYQFSVEDNDHVGFKDLSHAWTLFAPSEKRSNPDKIGMFNLGEKLAIAACREFVIITTTGGVSFTPAENLRKTLRTRRERGTLVSGTLTSTKELFDTACQRFRQIIPRPGVRLVFNGEVIQHRIPAGSITGTLPTPVEVPGEAGPVMAIKPRETTVEFYEVLPGEEPTLYGNGIPISASDGKYHYLVRQRIPLSMERDSVEPKYLAKLHLLALNTMHSHLTPDEVQRPYVQAALVRKDVTTAAVQSYKDKKWGDRAVVYDPSDRESNDKAVSEGYKVIHGGSESPEVFAKFRETGMVLPAGRVVPTPKPFSPDGKPLNLLDPEKKTRGHRRFDRYARLVWEGVINGEGTLTIVWADDPGWRSHRGRFKGCYGPSEEKQGGVLHINVAAFPEGYFDLPPATHADAADFLIHEYAHHTAPNHLSAEYHEACTLLGGKLHVHSIKHPDYYAEFVTRE